MVGTTTSVGEHEQLSKERKRGLASGVGCDNDQSQSVVDSRPMAPNTSLDLIVLSLKENVIPYTTVASSSLFSINFMESRLLMRPFGQYNVLAQNILFAMSHVGVASYVYEHLPKKNNRSKIKGCLYAATGSILFNYGALLMMANLKEYLPKSVPLKTLGASAVMGFLFWIGREYTNEIKEVN